MITFFVLFLIFLSLFLCFPYISQSHFSFFIFSAYLLDHIRLPPWALLNPAEALKTKEVADSDIRCLWLALLGIWSAGGGATENVSAVARWGCALSEGHVQAVYAVNQHWRQLGPRPIFRLDICRPGNFGKLYRSNHFFWRWIWEWRWVI